MISICFDQVMVRTRFLFGVELANSAFKLHSMEFGNPEVFFAEVMLDY